MNFTTYNQLSSFGRVAKTSSVLAIGGTIGAMLWRQLWKCKSGNNFNYNNQNNDKENTMSNSNSSTIFDEPFPFGKMQSRGKGNISLKSVSTTGDITGLLFSSTIRQEYKNETKETLEIIYTFPVGWGTALLDMSATIAGKHLKGEVVEKMEAEETYEKAISEGDSAIMVQKSSMGLYTANLGNIKPDETVIVELHCAQLLNFVQGQVRLCIPTVIGQRYGNPYGPGGLSRHESVQTDNAVSYSFSLELNLWDEIAKGKVSCPTHSVIETKLENGLNIRLDSNAVLDRDFVLLMDGVGGQSHALAIQDEDNWMMSASFAPDMQQQEVSPIALKILVDCSGSMSGGSIKQAQKGLQKILELLTEKDQVSYSRFGSRIEHMTNTMLPCGMDTIQRLSKAIDATDANMGGTEMEKALQSTFNSVKNPKGNELPPVVLLITDGDVWDIKNIIDNAKKSGHRIFAIGVGNAPAESLLRDMAEKTMGACEFVTENENMAEAIVHMFHRMRGLIARNINIDWQRETIWKSANPKFIYDGETVHSFAIFKSKPATGPVLNWEADGKKYSESCGHVETGNNADLVRLGHMVQFDQTDSKEQKLKIALKYQLVTDLTSLILVYERAEGDKTQGLPHIQHVPQMPAYGHGCSGMHFSTAGICMESFVAMPGRMMFDSFAPIFQENMEKVLLHDKNTLLQELVSLWDERIYELKIVSEFFDQTLQRDRFKPIADILSEIIGTSSLDKEAVYAIFMLWLLEKENDLSRHSLRILNHAVNGLEETEISSLKKKMEEWLQAA